MITDVLESLVRYAQNRLTDDVQVAEDKTLAISCAGLFRPWEPGKYEINDIRTKDGQVWRCCQAHDNANNPDIVPGAAAAHWVAYHSQSAYWAKPFVRPTGAHDAYSVGEYCIWTDDKTYKCIIDGTVHSPEEYPTAWEVVANGS